MKVYLSARFRDRGHLRIVRDRIWALGHEVNSTWLDETVPPNGMDQDTFNLKIARKDMVEVLAADCIIMDTQEGLVENAGGGREIEYGMALGQHQHKLIWLVGSIRGPFHLLADHVFSNWDEALEELRKIGSHDAYVRALGELAIKEQSK